MNRRSRWLACLLLLAGCLPFAWAGWERVPVFVNEPPKLETRPGEKVLVTLVRADEHELFDIGAEISSWLRREIERETSLVPIDVTPPQIPEQRPEILAVNDRFWKRLGEDFGADLIVAGIAEFRIEDRSGYVTEDQVSEVTGQTVRRTVFRDRTAFRLKLRVFFLKGANGALLHSDTWQEERILEGNEREDLHVLYQVLDVLSPDLRGVFLPMKLAEPRFIWIDR